MPLGRLLTLVFLALAVGSFYLQWKSYQRETAK
jgi:hypothetical protein